MATNCNLKFNETEVGTNLKSEVGSNDTLFNALMSAVIDGNRPSGFNVEFESYYKANYGFAPDVHSSNKNVSTAVMDFYANKNFDVNFQTKDSAFIRDVKSKGYTDTAAKVAGIRIAGNQMLMFYHDDLINGRLDEHAEDRKNNLANRTIIRMRKGIATGILLARKEKPSKDAVAKVEAELTNATTNGFSKLEDEVAKYTPQLRNQLATFKDMTADKVKYFTQVLQTDSRLGEIRFKKDDDLNQQDVDWNDSYAQEDSFDDNTDSATDENVNSEKDTTTANWENNGTKSDFMKDYSFAIRSYLSTIPKLVSSEFDAKGRPIYDKSNPLGMVDYMDCKSVISAIQGDRDVTNINAFIAKLKNIAESNNQYAGLTYMANDLQSHPDFAYKVFQVFQRSTIRKQQVRIDDNTVKPTRSNSKADKVETLKLNYLNDIKSTALNIMGEDTNLISLKVGQKINGLKSIPITDTTLLKRQALSAEIINDIATRLKQYYPSLDKGSIERYARLNKNEKGEVDLIANLNRINSYLKYTGVYGDDTLNNKKTLDAQLAKAKKMPDGKAKDEAVANALEAYKQGYLANNTKTYALELAKELAPYSVVNIDCNSTNALGNQSADQINDSMITNFLNAVKGTLMETQADGKKVSTELVNYGKYKFQGSQYDLSGILVEHKDNNGQLINRGLFYKDNNGEYQITDYARDLINVSLFDGAGDPVSKNNVLYSGMSKGDYVYTGFAQYFNAEQDVKGITMGDYFMRIPSDAPKNFVVHMPRYSVNGLFSSIHTVKDKDGNITSETVNVDNINENHPIVKQFANIFKQELTDMANFINTVFETNSQGQIIYKNNGEPRFKNGWEIGREHV